MLDDSSERPRAVANDSPVSRCVVDDSTQNRSSSPGLAVCANQFADCHRVEQGNVCANDNDIAVKPVKCGERELNGPARSRGLVLIDNHDAVGVLRNNQSHGVALMANDRDGVLRVKCRCRGKHVPDERDPCERVQNLRNRGLHPSTFTSGENHHGEGGIGHVPILALRCHESGRAPRNKTIRAE